MGERLCVDVQRHGDDIATVYFHWSAYSLPAFSELQKVVNILTSSERFVGCDLASMSDDEIVYGLALELHGVNKRPTDRDAFIALCSRLGRPMPDDSLIDGNRNYGLLCMPASQGGTGDSDAEGLAFVDLDSRTVSNDCFWCYENEDELIGELSEGYGLDASEVAEALHDAPTMPSPSDVSWTDLDDVAQAYYDADGITCGVIKVEHAGSVGTEYLQLIEG